MSNEAANSNFGAALKPTFKTSVRSDRMLQSFEADGERQCRGGFSPESHCLPHGLGADVSRTSTI